MEFRPRYPLGPVVMAVDLHALRPGERIRGAQHPSILLRPFCSEENDPKVHPAPTLTGW